MTKRLSFHKAILLFVLCLSSAPYLFSQETLPSLAILDFKASGISKGELDVYMEMVSSYLVETN